MFEARTPTELRILPLIVMLPAMIAVLVEPTWQVIVTVVGLVALLVWAAFTARVSLRVGEDGVEVSGPFYQRLIAAADIDAVKAQRDDGMSPSLVHWPVVGRATSPGGVRLNLGGRYGIQIGTTTGERYTVVLDSEDDARTAVLAVQELVAGHAES